MPRRVPEAGAHAAKQVRGCIAGRFKDGGETWRDRVNVEGSTVALPRTAGSHLFPHAGWFRELMPERRANADSRSVTSSDNLP